MVLILGLAGHEGIGPVGLDEAGSGLRKKSV